MIRFTNVGKQFRDGKSERWVLDGLSFEIEPQETVAVWGPSGCGKTTLLNLVAGLLKADRGEIRIAVSPGQPFLLDELNETGVTTHRKKNIGFVYQFFNLIPALSLEENVLLPLELSGRGELKEKALQRIESLGIEDRKHAFPDELSGGEQQRAAIARALAHEPAIVLADEPTGNLDQENSAIVLDLFWKEVRALGTTLLIATHNPQIRERADRIIEL